MTRALSIALAVFVGLHGVVHLIGTVGYMRLAKGDALPSGTSLLAGRWGVGERGMWLYGLLYAIAAIGFVVAVAAWQLRWEEWRALLLGTAAFSLLLTALDWDKAWVGTLVNAAILVGVLVGGRVVAW